MVKSWVNRLILHALGRQDRGLSEGNSSWEVDTSPLDSYFHNLLVFR
jgi:hypothetical protein